MAEEMEVGCARPTGGPVGESVEEESKQVNAVIKKEVSSMIQVGKKAPDFSAGYPTFSYTSIRGCAANPKAAGNLRFVPLSGLQQFHQLFH